MIEREEETQAKVAQEVETEGAPVKANEVSASDGFMLTGDAAGRDEPTVESWDEQGLAKPAGDKLYLELDGWEGPLDLL
ncbi:MAG: hypothetical protein AAF692_13215, partial [Pseudomonadota bacterium]